MFKILLILADIVLLAAATLYNAGVIACVNMKYVDQLLD